MREVQIAMGVFEGAFNLVTVFMELLHYTYSSEPHKASVMSSTGIVILIYR